MTTSVIASSGAGGPSSTPSSANGGRTEWDAWESLIPGPTDRAVFVGQTGSGKTTLARELLRTRRFVVVIDSKGTLSWPEYLTVQNWRELMRAGNEPLKWPRLLYRPSYQEMQDDDVQERVWEWLYQRGSCTIYVDETAAITRGDQAPDGYGAGLMRGRERGIEMWSATQRPTRIPQIVLSESEHVYAFHLRLRRDRVRVEELSGIDEDAIEQLAKRQFIYASQEDGVTGPFRLRLPGTR